MHSQFFNECSCYIIWNRQHCRSFGNNWFTVLHIECNSVPQCVDCVISQRTAKLYKQCMWNLSWSLTASLAMKQNLSCQDTSLSDVCKSMRLLQLTIAWRIWFVSYKGRCTAQHATLTHHRENCRLDRSYTNGSWAKDQYASARLNTSLAASVDAYRERLTHCPFMKAHMFWHLEAELCMMVHHLQCIHPFSQHIPVKLHRSTLLICKANTGQLTTFAFLRACMHDKQDWAFLMHNILNMNVAPTA